MRNLSFRLDLDDKILPLGGPTEFISKEHDRIEQWPVCCKCIEISENYEMRLTHFVGRFVQYIMVAFWAKEMWSNYV